MTMTVTPIKISDSEWEVMRVIWTQGSTTAQEIIAILGQTMEWKPANGTVRKKIYLLSCN